MKLSAPLPLVLLACLAMPRPEESGGGAPASGARPASAQQAGGAAPASGDAIERAEEHFRAGSYARAHELYAEVLRAARDLAPEQRAWVEFRLEDARWRSAAQSADPDTGELDQAVRAIEAMLARFERPETRSELYAELHESLGDARWRERHQDWGGAPQHYTAALEWWARSSDLERARARYLGIVWKATLPEWRERNWGDQYFPAILPLEVLANAVAIARSDEDRARANYVLARTWMNQARDRRSAERVEGALEAVIALGKRGEWYDDALFALGNFFEEQGRFEADEHGNAVPRPDFTRALALYRRLADEFAKGETRFHDDCRRRIRDISAPSLALAVERFFLPGSDVRFRASWRNLAGIELELVPIDLTRDVAYGSNDSDDWLATVTPRGAGGVRWTHDTRDRGDHQLGQDELEVPRKPETGAHLLVARGGGKEARALVLVSDAAVTVKAAGDRLLAWATDARSGAPIAEADLRLFERWHDGSGWHRRDRSEQSGVDGIASFELAGSGGQYFVALKSGARQCFAQGWVQGKPALAREWRIYAYTDRGAYRPGDEVQWKLWARTRWGTAYETPAGQAIAWEILDPQGAVASEGTSTLNAFGAAWGSLATTSAMALGEYRARFFRAPKKGEFLGEAALFRLEEYKLPEYEVRVEVPRDADGRPKLFRLGDRVELEIAARYYHGAPVADAAVEVFVHQRPRYRPLQKVREFPWFYADEREIAWWGGQGQQILHETRRSDPAGRTTIAFETPIDARGEFEFVVEARVVDASRREVVGQGTVVVAEQGYRVEVDVGHALHRPGAKVEVAFTASDPNGNPVAVQGEVVVTREEWIEIWCDASGREHFGEALERLQAEPGFPAPGWSLRSRGTERAVVARTALSTGADGKALFAFTPPGEGQYVAVWSSTDAWGGAIRAEGRLFVADERTRTLGYLPGGIEILVDRDTLQAGQDALVLLAAPQSGRWVLFTVEGERIYHHEVLQLAGQVRLVRVPITALHVPNVYLGAVSNWDGMAWQDVEELIVPPVEQFLDVRVSSDAPDYEPGAKGRIDVQVLDRAKKPVQAALSVALVDEAVDYVQAGYAIDPRRFFYGEKRAHAVQTGGSFQHGRYSDPELDRENEARRRQVAREGRADGDLEYDERLGSVDGFALGRAAKVGRGVYRGVSDSAVPASEPAARQEEGGAGIAAAPEALAAVRVRSDFRSTALWLPDVVTDGDGRAAVPVALPDATTRWKASVRACDAGARVGEGTTALRTRLPLIVRLQTPRFLVVGDEVTISGNLDNNLDAPLTVATALTVEGLEVLGRVVGGELAAGPVPELTIPASGSLRVDWRAVARTAGEAKLKLAAIGQERGDAVERTLPVHAHGIEAFVDLAGRSDEDAVELALELPRERAPATTRLTVTVAPSIAVTMLDALPYLVDYPYGCVEQTLSRFLPAVIVAKTLRDSGLSAEEAMERVFGGIERDSAGKTHPDGKKSLERLDEITRAGLERLYDFQHDDGGWAWWKEGDSNPFMSAYVLWGLALARDAGLDVRAGALETAARHLALELVEAESEPDLQAWMLHALASYGGAGRSAEERKYQAAAFDNLWKRRDGLNAYGRALLCFAAQRMGKTGEARTLLDNLRNGAILDRSPDTSVIGVGTKRPYVLPTAHWGQDGIYRRWSEGGVEATAFALRALVAVDPGDELVTPVMSWLVKNRRGAQWSNTRDTAICVLALNDTLRASGELGAPVAFELAVNGRTLASRRLEEHELLSAPSAFPVDPAWLKDGVNAVRITRTSGTAPLYFAARASFTSLEEPIPPRGNELFVRRDAYRLAARPTLLAGTVYERVALADEGSLASGERVEVVLTIEAKNELEYVVLEDLKPAGLETVQVRSGEPIAAQELQRGESAARFGEGGERRRAGEGRDVRVEARVGDGYTGRARHAHQELRDRHVAFFLEKLPQGLWELRYELRAEAPGRFHALPTLAHAMYVPEIRANGAELRTRIVDPPSGGDR